MADAEGWSDGVKVKVGGIEAVISFQNVLNHTNVGGPQAVAPWAER